MISSELRLLIEQKLCVYSKHESIVIAIENIAGGCINETVKIETTSGNYFLKWNSKKSYPGMFEAERKGLTLLNQQKALKIPFVITSGETENQAFLLLEYIESGSKAENFWNDFGKSLATLHKTTAPEFGLDHDNYIGSLAQSNLQNKSWTSFFIQERLEPQIKLARDKGQIETKIIEGFASLYKKLEEIFIPEPPALIHGDLWSGNFTTTEKGLPCIFDPAVYFGHREMDIAMSRLFGGFDQQFYNSYNSHFPLQKGWEERIDICNLYPLLVHVNLFGGGYLQQIKMILKKF
ncbi:MAG: fructosamine kinase family protein [Bacteroidota bacterium]|nr:fructosamine kinase family protein [Bacteroidota bacterium]